MKNSCLNDIGGELGKFTESSILTFIFLSHEVD